ncbi:MAG TPA: hypothetical protein VIU45_02620 [Chitinophagaceae bacterium]
MRKICVIPVVILVCCLLILPGCSLFRKSTTTPRSVTRPPATRPAPAVKMPEKEKEVVAPPFNVAAFAKAVKKPSYNIALFSPLYLDSVVDSSFSASSIKPLPRFALPGLEFYEGTQLAIDTLKQEGYHLNIYVYDTKSSVNSITRVLQSQPMNNADLVIGYVTTPSELKQLGDFAENKKINFVSATYPNDAGINNNPFLIIINSTLRTHCTGMQNFAQEKFSNKNIVIFRRDEPQEERTAAYIEEAYRKMKFDRKTPVRVVDWNDATTEADLAKHLRSDKNNICIVTALVEDQAKNIIKKFADLAKSYTINVIGMPTIDGDKDLLGPDYKGLNIYYSTPYFNQKTDRMSQYVINNFKRIYKVRPSDMAFKGFEAMYYFARLLKDNGVYFNSAINEVPARVITPFDFQPVYRQSGDPVPDYFENMHLYFLQLRDGVITPAN